VALVNVIALLALHPGHTAPVHAAAPRPTPAQTPAPIPAAPLGVVAAPRALTMEGIADSSAAELRIGSVRARYSLSFFGDTFLSVGNPTAPNRPLSFALGAQDLLLKGELGNHIVASTEIAIEPHDGGVVVDIERFHVRWQKDGLLVEAGRTHTNFGYWNNAYHHGQWLQLTIERPRWVAFEDDEGLLPVHWVGLNLAAKLNIFSSNLNLFLSVGNGRGNKVDDVRNARDYQSLKALHAAAELVGIHWPELRAGVSGTIDRIPAQPMAIRPALADITIGELIGGAYVAFAGYPLLMIAESYVVIHRAENHPGFTHQWTTFGGFGLIGYAFGRYTPYFEIERIAFLGGGTDPFWVPDPAQNTSSFNTARAIVGLRIDLTDWTALKAEYRFTRSYDMGSTLQEGIVDWSWGF
jgi:hypothetical protein